MIVEVEITGFTIGTVLQMTVDKVDWLTRAVCEVTTVVEVLVLVTICVLASQPATCSHALLCLLTDVSLGDSGHNFGRCGLECGIHGSHYGGHSRGPGRRLVQRCRHNGGDRLNGSLRQCRVDSRAS
jgi:hypothetical protein